LLDVHLESVGRAPPFWNEKNSCFWPISSPPHKYIHHILIAIASDVGAATTPDPLNIVGNAWVTYRPPVQWLPSAHTVRCNAIPPLDLASIYLLINTGTDSDGGEEWVGPPSEGRAAIPTSQEMSTHLLNVPPLIARTISKFSEDIRQPHVHPRWIWMGNGWWAGWAYQCPFSRSRACERFFLLRSSGRPTSRPIGPTHQITVKHRREKASPVNGKAI